jgi:hypothetical protein
VVKSVGDGLKSQPKQFEKYISNLKREDTLLFKLKWVTNLLQNLKLFLMLCFTNHFKFNFNTSYPAVTPPYSVTTDFLPTEHISAA